MNFNSLLEDNVFEELNRIYEADERAAAAAIEESTANGYAEGGFLDTSKRAGGVRKVWKDALEGKKTKTVKAKDLKPGMVTSTGEVQKVIDIGWRGGEPCVEVSYGGIGARGSYACDRVPKDRDYEILDEGIFDRKPSAVQEELIDEFKNKAEKITKKPLNSVASDLTNLLKSTIAEYRVAWLKANKDTAKTSITNAFEDKASGILKTYTNLIKALAKPNNFYQAALEISNAAAGIIEDFESQSSAYKKLQVYENVLNQLSSIETDRKTLQFVLKEFFGDLVYILKDDLAELKNRPTHTLFKESINQDDIVDESLLDVNLPIDIDVQANGNDVSVGTLG